MASGVYDELRNEALLHFYGPFRLTGEPTHET